MPEITKDVATAYGGKFGATTIAQSKAYIARFVSSDVIVNLGPEYSPGISITRSGGKTFGVRAKTEIEYFEENRPLRLVAALGSE